MGNSAVIVVPWFVLLWLVILMLVNQLMNAIGKSDVFVENKLLTLDTTVRKVVIKPAFLTF
jgi:hypothetical protein